MMNESVHNVNHNADTLHASYVVMNDHGIDNNVLINGFEVR